MATAADYTLLTQQLYLANLRRPADYHGLAAVSAYLANANAPTTLPELQQSYASNAAVRDLVNSMSGSVESANLYGRGSGSANFSDAAYVNAVYTQLLNRNPELEGLTFWVVALKDKAITRAALAGEILSAAMKAGGNGVDGAVVANKLLFAQEFTASINTPERIAQFSGENAAIDARNLELTIRADMSGAAILSLVNEYWYPKPIFLGGSVAETQALVGHVDSIELIGAIPAALLV